VTPDLRRFRLEAAAVAAVVALWAAWVYAVRPPAIALTAGTLIAATVAAAVSARRGFASTALAARQAWAAVALGSVVLAGCAFAQLITGEIDWTVAGRLAALALFLGGLLRGAVGPLLAHQRLRLTVDGLTIGWALFLLWTHVSPPAPVTAVGGAVVESLAWGLGLPVALALGVIALLVLSRSGGESTAGLRAGRLGSLGMAVLGATAAVASLASVDGSERSRLAGIGWVVGLALLALAARAGTAAAATSGSVALAPPDGPATGNPVDVAPPAGLADEPGPDERPAGAGHPAASGPLESVLPYLSVILAVLAVAVGWLDHRSHDPMVWGLLVLVLCLVGRQLLELHENAALTRSLETRVAERTARLSEQEQWFRSLVQHSSDVVSVIDREGIVRYQTPSLRRIFGFPAGTFVGGPVSALLDPTDADRVGEALPRLARTPGESAVVELLMRDADGQVRQTESTITNLLDDPHVRGLVVNTRDVSERKRLEQELSHQAFHDALTGLANRALFRDRVEHALAARARDGRPLAVLFLDLDGFKEVNDTLGHAAGDQLLGMVAARLLGCVRPGDTVARFGGDEFTVLLEQLDGEGVVDEVVNRILEQVGRPLRLGNRELTLRVSLGIAVADTGEETAEMLLRNADLAMYQAKAAGGAGAVRFQPVMYVSLVRRIEDEGLLRHAAGRGQLRVHYQPTVDLNSGAVVSAEALVRWQHPQRGLLLPADFVPLAEDSGLIVEIGEWVLRRACEQAAAWYADGLDLSVAVNVSGRQLRDGTLPELIDEVLAGTQLPADRLVLEMTESQLVERNAEMVRLLRRLKRRGLHIAIDDFGTGYSSLSYLSRFPVDVLKVDRSFVEGCAHQSQNTELTRTIVTLAAALGMKTVAEGVEDLGQLAALRVMGCTYGQGYLFAAPCDGLAVAQLARASAEPPAVHLA